MANNKILDMLKTVNAITGAIGADPKTPGSADTSNALENISKLIMAHSDAMNKHAIAIEAKLAGENSNYQELVAAIRVNTATLNELNETFKAFLNVTKG